MPPKAYKTVSVTDHVYDRIVSLREELLRRGFSSLPPGIAPEKGTALTVSEVIEIAIRSAEQAMRGGRKQ